MRCWDARITHRLTFKELNRYYYDYLKNSNKNEITIQIKKKLKNFPKIKQLIQRQQKNTSARNLSH